MKNKVYSSKFAAIFFVTFSINFMIGEFAITCLLIKNLINESGNIVLELILIVGFLPFIFLFGFIANRFGYTVVYDSKNNMIIRKGLICGYKYLVKVEDIQDIIIATFPKETTYYILIDSYNTKFNGGYKKSFIRIEKTEKSYEFIRQFWNKQIKDNYHNLCE